MTEIIFADNTSPEMREEVLRLAATWKPNKRTKLVQAHGINDADYITQATTIYGKWQCPLYEKWAGIMQRVYSTTLHNKWPTYIGTQIHTDWLSFMNFRSWCLKNGWRSSYHIDKDYISNSKLYGPDTCAFIPSIVNSFITDASANRGSCPIGVDLYGNRFRSHCSNPFTKKYEYLGIFQTQEEAHNAWKQKKHQHALALANMFPDLDPRVLQSLRTRYE